MIFVRAIFKFFTKLLSFFFKVTILSYAQLMRNESPFTCLIQFSTVCLEIQH